MLSTPQAFLPVIYHIDLIADHIVSIADHIVVITGGIDLLERGIVSGESPSDLIGRGSDRSFDRTIAATQQPDACSDWIDEIADYYSPSAMGNDVIRSHIDLIRDHIDADFFQFEEANSPCVASFDEIDAGNCEVLAVIAGFDGETRRLHDTFFPWCNELCCSWTKTSPDGGPYCELPETVDRATLGLMASGPTLKELYPRGAPRAHPAPRPAPRGHNPIRG